MTTASSFAYRTAGLALLAAGLASSSSLGQAPRQPQIGSRVAPLLRQDGLTFRDLNKNGRLDPYEDWRLPVERRVEDLLSRMTLEEKTGLMFHASIQGAMGPNGEVTDRMGSFGGGGREPAVQPTGVVRAIRGRMNPYNVEPVDAAPARELILKRGIRWAVIRPGNEAPEVTAKFINGLQEIAEGSRLGIPMVPSDNPRSGIRRTVMGVEMGPAGSAARQAGPSRWPGQLGLAAIGDPAAVRQHAEITSRELRAMGIRALLGPMADIATEPRWSRISGTFGEDGEWTARLVREFVEGFQGRELGPDSVLTVTKHFPGDGPVKDGYDPHSSYGKWTIYPANQFDYHLAPFRAAIEAGTGAIMGGYMIPAGKDTVGVNFSKAMITDLLRGRLGFQGVVVTDSLRSMPWGVEHLSQKDRHKTMVLAGVDQILSDNDPKYVLECVREGSISEERITASARRILRATFQLGLFENPYVDPDKAREIVGRDEYVKAGYLAQVRSVVLLKNSGGILPLPAGKKIYVQNLDAQAAGRYGTVAGDPKQADFALIKITTPAIVYPFGGGFGFGGGARAGAGEARRGRPEAAGAGTVQIPLVLGNTLAYTGSANQKQLDDVLKLAAAGVPTIVCVEMDRPTILTEFIDSVAGVFATFGVTDGAWLSVVFGEHKPEGRLPFNLPSDMPSVAAQSADAAHDLEDPLFRFGFGLRYNR